MRLSKIRSYLANHPLVWRYTILAIVSRLIIHALPFNTNHDLDQFKYHQMDLFYNGIMFWNELWTFVMPYPKLIYILFYPVFFLTDLLGLEFPVRTILRKASMALIVDCLEGLNIIIFYEFIRRFFAKAKQRAATHITLLAFILTPALHVPLLNWGGHYLIPHLFYTYGLYLLLFYIYNKPIISSRVTYFASLICFTLAINAHVKELVYTVFLGLFLFGWFFFSEHKRKIASFILGLLGVGLGSIIVYWWPAHHIELIYLQSIHHLMPTTLNTPSDILIHIIKDGLSFSLLFFAILVIDYCSNKLPHPVFRPLIAMTLCFTAAFQHTSNPLGCLWFHSLTPIFCGYALSKIRLRYGLITLSICILATTIPIYKKHI